MYTSDDFSTNASKLIRVKKGFTPIIIILCTIILISVSVAGIYFSDRQVKKSSTEIAESKQIQETPTPISSSNPNLYKPITFTKPTIKPTVKPTPEAIVKDYSACFSQYDKKYIPKNIGKFTLVEIQKDYPLPNNKFTNGVDYVNTSWGLTALYKKTQLSASFNETLLMSVIGYPDFSYYTSVKNELLTLNESNINGLQVYVDSIHNDIGIISFIPGSKSYFAFSFAKNTSEAVSTVSLWLKQVCPNV